MPPVQYQRRYQHTHQTLPLAASTYPTRATTSRPAWNWSLAETTLKGGQESNEDHHRARLNASPACHGHRLRSPRTPQNDASPLRFRRPFVNMWSSSGSGKKPANSVSRPRPGLVAQLATSRGGGDANSRSPAAGDGPGRYVVRKPSVASDRAP